MNLSVLSARLSAFWRFGRSCHDPPVKPISLSTEASRELRTSSRELRTCRRVRLGAAGRLAHRTCCIIEGEAEVAALCERPPGSGSPQSARWHQGRVSRPEDGRTHWTVPALSLAPAVCTNLGRCCTRLRSILLRWRQMRGAGGMGKSRPWWISDKGARIDSSAADSALRRPQISPYPV